MQACTEYEQIGGTIERSKHHHLPILQQSHAKPYKAMQSHAKNKPFMQDQHGYPGETSRTACSAPLHAMQRCFRPSCQVKPSILSDALPNRIVTESSDFFSCLLYRCMYLSAGMYSIYTYPAYTLLYSTYTLLYSTFTLHTLHICN
jgi:hypothetical protein